MGRGGMNGGRASVETLRLLLECDPATGKLTWRPRTPEMFTAGRQSARRACLAWNTRYAGKEAFTAISRGGYKVGSIDYRLYPAQDIVFAMTTGRWPIGIVDHRDGDRTRNAFGNLREATDWQNKQNVGGRSKTRPFIGVFRANQKTGWCATVCHAGSRIHVGTFDTPEQAAVARDDVAIRLRGEFARLNFPEAGRG